MVMCDTTYTSDSGRNRNGCGFGLMPIELPLVGAEPASEPDCTGGDCYGDQGDQSRGFDRRCFRGDGRELRLPIPSPESSARA